MAGRNEIAKATWIIQHQVKNVDLVTALRRDLDSGESESIALALEINADLLLLDEKEGRRTAQRQDIDFVGVVGVLLEAKHSGHVDSILLYLDALRQNAGFYFK